MPKDAKTALTVAAIIASPFLLLAASTFAITFIGRAWPKGL